MPLPAIVAFDNFLGPAEHQQIWEFLKGPGWAFGAYSDDGGSRYFYKHFAGYVLDGQEAREPAAIEAELEQFPIVQRMWQKLKAGPLQGHALARCYANGMPPGAEGGVHLDSNIDTHFTAIYYPHLTWNPNFGGETLLFNPDATDIISAVYPKPDRLFIFPGTIPHVARPLSIRASELRITLMFKTQPLAA
jgi:SM-20-related protein